LMNVQEGMIVDIPAFETIRVFVEGEELFTGMMGDRDGKLAVRVVG